MRLRGLIGSLLVATLGASDGASAIVGLPDPPAPAGHGRGIQVAPPAGTVALPEHKAPRHLVLKLRAEAANACVSCMLARQQPLGEVVPGSQLDALNHRFGVSAARPLLGAFAQKLIPEPHAHALARQQQVALRFPLREQRAPRRAVVPDFSRIYVLDVRRRSDLETVAHGYAADPAVEYCEPDYIVEAAYTPNDPYFSSSGSWGQNFDDLWGVKKIGAPAAWDTTHGAGVVVAVVDTGVDYTHPDLAANIWSNPGETPNNGVDDDGNGYVDDIHGWNFVDDNNDPQDLYGHGTHVAGTIAAVGDNALGVVGVAFESHIMPVRALNRYGDGAIDVMAQAIVYAVDNGADVINASWGGTGQSALIADATAYAHAHGVVFVAAAGNGSTDMSTFFPANDANAIAVAATTHLDAAASFSNFGVKLDVAAPGGGDAPPPPTEDFPEYSVLSLRASAAQLLYPLNNLIVGNGYLRLAGTSMAAPHVAGTAALILAVHPEFSVEQVRQVLRTTADDLGAPGVDATYGYGRVNAASAVAVSSAPLVAHLSSPVAQTLVGQTSVSITGAAGGLGFTSYTVEYGLAPAPTSWTVIAGPVATPVDDSLLATWDLTNVPDGDYVLRLRVDGPAEYVDRAPVTVRNVVIDIPAPLTALRNDAPIEIRGTAAGAGFSSYAVEYRRPGVDPTLWRTDGITLAVSPGTPVRNGLLATFDASELTAGDRFDFRLTVVNGAGTPSWYRSGIVIDPTLHPGWPQSLSPVADRNYLTVADLDGDGKKEILVGSGDEVVVFEPDGSVRPGWPQSVATPETLGVASAQGSPIVADVAGDAAPEVITTDGISLFVWSADGVLLPGFPRVVGAFDGAGYGWITAADLNGDGKDEIICSSWGVSQAFFGDGTQVPGWDPFQDTGDGPVAVGDVFGDGRIEVALFNYFFDKWSFTHPLPPHSVWLRSSDRTRMRGWPRHAGGGDFTHVGMADLTGDGQLDVIVLNEPDLGKTGRTLGPVSVAAYSGRGRRIAIPKY